MSNFKNIKIQKFCRNFIHRWLTYNLSRVKTSTVHYSFVGRVFYIELWDKKCQIFSLERKSCSSRRFGALKLGVHLCFHVPFIYAFFHHFDLAQFFLIVGGRFLARALRGGITREHYEGALRGQNRSVNLQCKILIFDFPWWCN